MEKSSVFFYERCDGNYYSSDPRYCLKNRSSSRGGKVSTKGQVWATGKMMGHHQSFLWLPKVPTCPSRQEGPFFTGSCVDLSSDGWANCSSQKRPTRELSLLVRNTSGQTLLSFSVLLALTLCSFWLGRGEIGLSVYEMPAGIKSMPLI